MSETKRCGTCGSVVQLMPDGTPPHLPDLGQTWRCADAFHTQGEDPRPPSGCDPEDLSAPSGPPPSGETCPLCKAPLGDHVMDGEVFVCHEPKPPGIHFVKDGAPPEPGTLAHRKAFATVKRSPRAALVAEIVEWLTRDEPTYKSGSVWAEEIHRKFGGDHD